MALYKSKSDDEFEIIEMQTCKGTDEDGFEMIDIKKPKSPRPHITRSKNNNESSHNDNIELLHERRDKLSNLAASSENLANKTQQYRDNMEAVNKTLARRYRLSNRRLTIAIIAITVCVVIAVVVAVILFTNKS
ncbi:uncharacterized protein LOC125668065 isoform X2 [Ostrea edulis]|uniref:uncharacterized protein LOC125668065 isoform X2 n=1 Tax=Ostrea edulis TaxID=37623 RepID=UPI0024AED7AC|nr:uncharacterized protein LOC125668065 isoform X2 [Ostrea edulis]XP_056017116.1 uncharacterized protein LOC125668065 isoform X2 [Ostrea edulis]